MSLKQQIDADLKQAMLAGDKELTSTLRGVKSAILYVEVAENKRDEGLSDEQLQSILAKEAKKRQESADLYQQGGNQEKAAAELTEKKVIEAYLPAQMGDEELKLLVSQTAQALNVSGPQAMGQLIGAVKAKAGGQADGSRIAALVKEHLQ